MYLFSCCNDLTLVVETYRDFFHPMYGQPYMAEKKKRKGKKNAEEKENVKFWRLSGCDGFKMIMFLCVWRIKMGILDTYILREEFGSFEPSLVGYAISPIDIFITTILT